MNEVVEEVIVMPTPTNVAETASSISYQNSLRSSANLSRIASIDIEGCLEDTGSNIKIISPQDAWLPITASRNGNVYYAAMHVLNSGIGFQALMLPVAFRVLGWTWGTICLSVLFVWQFYTIWLLIQLHESLPGTRYNRYLQLSMAAFGTTLGKLLALFPIMYLSSGACAMLILVASQSMRLFMKIGRSPTSSSPPLTTVECYLVFICLAIFLAQLLPNLNSVAWISLIGAIAAVAYCMLFWAISISKTRPNGISYDGAKPYSEVDRALSVLNALGIVALAFRGHNLILEIQATIPSTEKHPSRVSMSRGVNFAYLIIISCLFPVAIGGYWAYGDKIPSKSTGGMLTALDTFHGQDTSKFLLKLTTLLVVIHCFTSFQVYAMPAFDNYELVYITRKKKPCPRWVRFGIRTMFGCFTLFIAVAVPFIRSLAGLIGGLVLPVTFAYPCFMWIAIKKPPRFSLVWCINLVLGSLGMVLSIGVFAGGVYSLVRPGVYVRFFKS